MPNRDRPKPPDSSADDYLVKPFAITELVARVRVLTRHAQVRRDDTLVLGSLRMDLAAGAGPWVGWFPLASGEPCRPGFAASGRCLLARNAALPGVPGVAIAAPTSYRNAQTSLAATAVAREAFGSNWVTADARMPLSPAALTMAGVLATHRAPAPAGVGCSCGQSGPGGDGAGSQCGC